MASSIKQAVQSELPLRGALPAPEPLDKWVPHYWSSLLSEKPGNRGSSGTNFRIHQSVPLA